MRSAISCRPRVMHNCWADVSTTRQQLVRPWFRSVCSSTSRQPVTEEPLCEPFSSDGLRPSTSASASQRSPPDSGFLSRALLHDGGLTSCCVFLLTTAPAAFAGGDGVSYNPAAGAEYIKSIVGGAYVLLVGYFLFRLFARRAQKARSERIASKRGDVQEQVTQVLEDERQKREAAAAAAASAAAVAEEQKRTPLQALGSAVVCGSLSFGMYLFAGRLSEVLDTQTLSDQYTVHTVSVTVRTILLGLVYLATFIFGANSIGLFGLAIQMVVDPKGLEDSLARSRSPPPSEPQLPRITVRATSDEVRRAFDKVAQSSSQTQAQSRPSAPSSDDSSSSG